MNVTSRPVDVDALFRDPKVLQEATKQCWEEGDMKGAARYLILLLKNKGEQPNILSQNSELTFLIFNQMKNAGIHLTF